MVHINQPGILSAAMRIPCFYSGAYVNAKTAVHFTPLLAAIRYAHPGPVELLLEKGANVMVKDRLKYYNPIMWAVEIQSPQILKVYMLTICTNWQTIRRVIIFSPVAAGACDKEKSSRYLINS